MDKKWVGVALAGCSLTSHSSTRPIVHVLVEKMGGNLLILLPLCLEV